MTKRIILIIAVIAFMFITIGATTPSDSNSYQYQFIKTTYRDDIEIKNIISSIEELNTFYEKYKDTLYLEHRETVLSDSTIGFIDAIEKYNKDFFMNNNIAIIYLTESSGSITLDLEKIKIENRILNIEIIKQYPKYTTCDMTGWIFLLELSKENNINQITIK